MNRPSHIAIVMDGNGRWAEQRKRPRSLGHQAGVRATRNVVEACADQQVKALTLFAFSSENWHRPAKEVSRLMDLFLRALNREVAELHKNGVRLRFIGDLQAFAPELRDGMDHSEQLTRNNQRLALNIAVNYGGRWDLTQATRRIAEKVAAGTLQADQIDIDMMASHCCLAELAELAEPDLLIRTGGERRISNFLLWQLAYTELYFCDTLWPDFDAEQLQLALDDFASRQRRFGRIKNEAKQVRNA